MEVSRRTLIACATTMLCAAAGVFGQAQPEAGQERFTIPFSDPARPGKLELSTFNGTVTIKGANRKDVLIVARSREAGRNRITRDSDTATTTGLRRLPQPGGFGVEEANNVMEISTGPGRGQDFDIEVPTRTNLEVSVINGGALTVSDVDGEMELSNLNGAMTLTNIAGSVVANANNGSIKAVLTRATPDKAMAFMSLNGAVDVTLPPTVRATFKLRSDMGNVYTDFDLQLKPAESVTPQRSGSGTRLEVNRSIYGAVNGGGPEIEMRTMNGTIYLRKGGAGK